MEKLDMQTANFADKNFEALSKLFPNAVTETIGENGEVVRAIDADILRQEISCSVVEGKDERYQFTWPDKKKYMVIANEPISKTLRPNREKSVDFDITGNIYIEGDNLEVLKLLQEPYLGKIKMIYIDPPYNTGNDFIYEDDFSINNSDYLEMSGQIDEQGNRLRKNLDSNGRYHTDWLNMIYARLKLSRDLLSEEGFIAISIGEEESYNLRKICNEIFGEVNFRNILSVRRYDKNINLQFAENGLSTMNVGLEYILIYSKNSTSKMRPVYREASDERSRVGYWKGFWNNADRPTMRYDILGFTPNDGQWKWKEDVALEAVKNYQEYERDYSAKMSLEEYWEKTGKTKRFIRRNMSGSGKNMGVEHWVAPSDGILRNSNWSDMLVSKPAGLDIPFDSPKNSDVIEELIKLFGVEDGDIVLDFFSGSATSGYAVMDLNSKQNGKLKYIMVQIPEQIDDEDKRENGFETICDIGEERIRRSGGKIKEQTKADIDYGFRVLELDSSNMKEVYYRPADTDQTLLDMFADNIKPDRTPEDLLFQVMLDLGVLLSSKIEETEIAGKKVFNVADGFLIACFDRDVTDETIKAVAYMKPYYAVFRDNSMKNDSVATNFDQIFANISPDTIRKVL